MHLTASTLHNVRHIDALLEGDSLNRSKGLGDLLHEACFRLHGTKVENEDLLTRLTPARAQVDENVLKIQCLTRLIGALEAHLEAFAAMRTESVAPVTQELCTYSVPCGAHDGKSGKWSRGCDVYTLRVTRSAPGRSELYQDGRGCTAPP